MKIGSSVGAGVAVDFTLPDWGQESAHVIGVLTQFCSR
jgi:hypothetical protein